LHLPISVGKEFYREIRPTGEKSNLDESQALEKACQFLKTQLIEAGIKEGDRSTLPQAICYTQPHGDLKEIRLTSWTLAYVLGRDFGFEYLWSTDSDTVVPRDTISNMASVLGATPTAGGASAYVQLHNVCDTPIAQMVGASFALDMYLNRAATGGLNKSEYLHGPATIFRLSALSEVIVKWSRFHYFFSDRSQNTVSTEEIQANTQLTLSQGHQ
jgi:hyaluronan synthase